MTRMRGAGRQKGGRIEGACMCAWVGLCGGGGWGRGGRFRDTGTGENRGERDP